MNEPKLRFKADDGSQFPEWEEKKIGDITTSRIENRVVVGTRQTSVFEPNFVNK